MPQGDCTGPMGQGSRTGKSLGYCSGHSTPSYAKGFGEGKQRGAGHGRGMGRRRGKYQGMCIDNTNSGSSRGLNWMSSMKKDDEIQLLKLQIDVLRHSQQTLEKRLEELANDNG